MTGMVGRLLLLLFLVVCSVSAFQQSAALRLRWQALGASAAVNVDGNNEVLRRTSDFLSKNLYEERIPEGQRRELRNLEFQDLQGRYGPTMGRRRYPSCLLLVFEDQDIIGSVGCDVQLLDLERKRFKTIKSPGSAAFDQGEGAMEAPVMANLAVRRNRRGQGIAKELVQAAEEAVAGWGASAPGVQGTYEYLYLLVDKENVPAQRLYRKMGYKVVYEAPGTCVVAGGTVGLRTEDCVNICMRKRVGRGGGGAGGGPLDFFSKLFKR